ncbi:MAG: tetratricopeptide repeat protein [Chloroflexia bacterium]
MTAFIGRFKELASVVALLRDPEVRLLTLTGPPGTGKTRLAMKASQALQSAFRDGIYFVPLAITREAIGVLNAVAQRLDLKQIDEQSAPKQVIEYLRERETMLLLDNFEQVLSAGPHLVDLLEQCPGLKILVTSRAALKVYGEQEFPVPPLALPDEEQTRSLTADTALEYEAVALFAHRARLVNPYFEVTDSDAPIVGQICRELDGLPLCIELAAARCKTIPPASLLALLDNKFDLLTSEARNLPLRQRTLVAAITWSYELLDPSERTLFNRLSIFVGGCTLAAAEYVCTLPGEPQHGMLDPVTSLMDKSLVDREDRAGQPRFKMLATLREYALDRLKRSGEMHSVHKQHARYFGLVVDKAEPYLHSPHRDQWLKSLDSEVENVRAALAWCLSDAGDPLAALRIAGALHWFWYFRGYLSEGRDWLERAFARVGNDLPTTVETAKALDAAGHLALLQDDYEAVQSHLTRALAMWRELGDDKGLAYSLSHAGIARVYRHADITGLALLKESLNLFQGTDDTWGLATAYDLCAEAHILLGDSAAAAGCYNESLRLFREMGDMWGIAAELGEISRVEIRQGNYVAAKSKLDEALSTERLVEDRWNRAHTLRSLGDVAYCLNDYQEAHLCYESAAELYRDLGDRMRMGACLRCLGHVALRTNQPENAKALYLHSLGIAASLGATPSLAWCLAAMAGWAVRMGEAIRAAELLGAADRLGKANHAILPVVDAHERARTYELIKSSLGKQEFALATVRGASLGTEDAITVAQRVAELGLKQESDDIPTYGGRRSPTVPKLSAREIEVVKLVEQGLSNAEIADALILSTNTVRAHLYSVFDKFGVPSRTAAVRYARENGLI